MINYEMLFSDKAVNNFIGKTAKTDNYFLLCVNLCRHKHCPASRAAVHDLKESTLHQDFITRPTAAFTIAFVICTTTGPSVRFKYSINVRCAPVILDIKHDP